MDIPNLEGLPAWFLPWFAGWLSADGSITNAGNGRPRIQFKICDRDPLDMFALHLGNEVSGPYPPSGLGKKPRFEWAVSGEAVIPLLVAVMPYLSSRYRSRATALLGYVPQRGRKLREPEVAVMKQKLYARHTGRSVAREHGVSEGLVSAIKAGRVWSDVQPKEENV